MQQRPLLAPCVEALALDHTLHFALDQALDHIGVNWSESGVQKDC